MIFKILYLIFFMFVCISSTSQNSQVLVISFDGFRHDFVSERVTPTLARLSKFGTHAEYLQNVFETKTFPNHQSIATGFYPYIHGVLSSSVYDPLLKRVLKYSAELWNSNKKVIPIWIYNENNGEERHSGVYMWPGSEFKYNNTLPTFIEKFNTSISWQQRVDTVINWFLHPRTPANLVMMYFEEPDQVIHHCGPNSVFAEDRLRQVDNITNYLLRALSEKNLSDTMNLFLVSDHGMTSVPHEHIIYIHEHLNSSKCYVAGSSPVLHVIPKNGYEEEIYETLKNLSNEQHFTVYRRNELPDQWLYKSNIRIPPLLLVADIGYGFDDILTYGGGTCQAKWQKILEGRILGESAMYGSHGYDNAFTEMRPFFIASGPKIRAKYTIKPFNTVDLFSLFCSALDLPQLKTNGSLSHVEDMLEESGSSLSTCGWITAAAAASVVALLLLLYLLIWGKTHICRTRRGNDFLATKEFEIMHLLDSTDGEE